MRSFAAVATLAAFCSALAVPAQAARLFHHGPTGKHHSRKIAHVKKVHGQREIQSERATEIQSALIKAHYLDGEPTGQWDSNTEAAMRKMQADNGWQTKITPDSRALIKLGLGPDHSSDLGAKSLTTQVSGAAPAPAVSGSAENR